MDYNLSVVAPSKFKPSHGILTAALRPFNGVWTATFHLATGDVSIGPFKSSEQHKNILDSCRFNTGLTQEIEILISQQESFTVTIITGDAEDKAEQTFVVRHCLLCDSNGLVTQGGKVFYKEAEFYSVRSPNIDLSLKNSYNGCSLRPYYNYLTIEDIIYGPKYAHHDLVPFGYDNNTKSSIYEYTADAAAPMKISKKNVIPASSVSHLIEFVDEAGKCIVRKVLTLKDNYTVNDIALSAKTYLGLIYATAILDAALWTTSAAPGEYRAFITRNLGYGDLPSLIKSVMAACNEDNGKYVWTVSSQGGLFRSYTIDNFVDKLERSQYMSGYSTFLKNIRCDNGMLFVNTLELFESGVTMQQDGSKTAYQPRLFYSETKGQADSKAFIALAMAIATGYENDLNPTLTSQLMALIGVSMHPGLMRNFKKTYD